MGQGEVRVGGGRCVTKRPEWNSGHQFNAHVSTYLLVYFLFFYSGAGLGLVNQQEGLLLIYLNINPHSHFLNEFSNLFTIQIIPTFRK